MLVPAPHDELEACAMVMPPFLVVLVKVEAIDCSVDCSIEASKLAEAPALEPFCKRQWLRVRVCTLQDY